MCRALGTQGSLRHKTISVVGEPTSSQSQYDVERAVVEVCLDLADAQGELSIDCDSRKKGDIDLKMDLGPAEKMRHENPYF